MGMKNIWGEWIEGGRAKGWGPERLGSQREHSRRLAITFGELAPSDWLPQVLKEKINFPCPEGPYASSLFQRICKYAVL